MSSADYRCESCGSIMVQVGTERQKAINQCRACGRNEYIDLGDDDNMEYWHKRSDLLGRIRKGIFDWEITNWRILRDDIVDFTSRYEEARTDVYLMIALVACITQGFHIMDKEQYKECKAIFKVTEKMYKAYRKNPTAPSEFKVEKSSSHVKEYEEYRNMYKKCQYEYQKEQLAWKIAFKMFKFLVPKFI